MLKKFKLTVKKILLYMYIAFYLCSFLLLVLVFITNSYDVKKKYT